MGQAIEDTGQSIVIHPVCSTASRKQKIKTYLSKFENPEAYIPKGSSLHDADCISLHLYH